ncbi:hypothetical protein CR513_15008, partial [Mucuna pruriens]
MEFLELKKGNSIVVDYATKFEEILRLFPHYQDECLKFINGLYSNIMQIINYQEIYQFPTLVNRCRIYDEYTKARTVQFKSKGLAKGKKNVKLAIKVIVKEVKGLPDLGIIVEDLLLTLQIGSKASLLGTIAFPRRSSSMLEEVPRAIVPRLPRDFALSNVKASKFNNLNTSCYPYKQFPSA